MIIEKIYTFSPIWIQNLIYSLKGFVKKLKRLRGEFEECFFLNSRMKNRIYSIDKNNIKEKELIFNLKREGVCFKTNFNISLNKTLDKTSKL